MIILLSTILIIVTMSIPALTVGAYRAGRARARFDLEIEAAEQKIAVNRARNGVRLPDRPRTSLIAPQRAPDKRTALSETGEMRAATDTYIHNMRYTEQRYREQLETA